MMKPTAFLINTARGPIVDQQALYTTLKERRIQGAALDVFAQEPATRDNPLIDLENVILSPHAVGVTDQCLRGIGESAVRSALTALRGDIPEHVVNREVLERPGMKAKLKANRKMWLAHEEEGTRQEASVFPLRFTGATGARGVEGLTVDWVASQREDTDH